MAAGLADFSLVGNSSAKLFLLALPLGELEGIMAPAEVVLEGLWAPEAVVAERQSPLVAGGLSAPLVRVGGPPASSQMLMEWVLSPALVPVVGLVSPFPLSSPKKK